MRRNIVHVGADQLRYEIREIVERAHEIRDFGIPIIWENIGDPVQKGESVPDWIKGLIHELVDQDATYQYTDSAGSKATRVFLAEQANKQGGVKLRPEDILFFNGLGDAVSTLFTHMRREARVLGPSPAYSTLSSAEASHSGYEHFTYMLDPHNGWQPNLADIKKKVRYNDSVAGILLINPDNPTGAVYPSSTLEAIVAIAREENLFVLADETYRNLVYPGSDTVPLSEVIDDVPGISLRSISKDFPWPGARCGWMEVYNQDKNPTFRRYIASLLDAKRLEVCSTTLPQMVIPRVMNHPKFAEHIAKRAEVFSKRADEAINILSRIPYISVVKPGGAFFLTITFNAPLPASGTLPPISHSQAYQYISDLVKNVPADKRFVYWLLGATGICTVPLSGFCSSLPGFRSTLLETDDAKRRFTYETLAVAITEYCSYQA